MKGAVEGKGFFGVALSRVTRWRGHLAAAGHLSGRKKEGLYFNYKDAPSAGKPLLLEIGPEDGPFRTVRAPYEG